MRIAFVWPHGHTVYHTLPLSFGLLHDALRGSGHTVRLFNLPLEGWTGSSPAFADAIAAFDPDLVGTTGFPIAFQSALEAVRTAKARLPRATFIVGGNYATLNPEQAWSFGVFDYVLLGESERSFPKFVSLLEARDAAGLEKMEGIFFKTADGRTVRNRNVFHDDLDRMGRVDYSFIDIDRCIERGYMKTVLGPKRKLAMFASRGCSYGCNFCTAPVMNGKKLRHYSIDYLLEEIRRVYDEFGIRMIFFMDDNVTDDPAFMKELCRGIIGLKLDGMIFEFYRGLRLEKLDAELLRLMKQANFEVVTIAPESGSERVRELMHKEMATEDIRRAARLVKEAGLFLQAYFIVGYPGETRAERQETYRLIDDLDLDIFELHKFMALPGTGSFLKLVKQGRIERDHTDSNHFIGEKLPNYNGDGIEVDREIMWQYLRFYARHPHRVHLLLRLVSIGGVVRSFTGIMKAGLRSMLPGARASEPAPSFRPNM